VNYASLEALLSARPVISRYRTLGKLPERLGRAPHIACQKKRILSGIKPHMWKAGGVEKMRVVRALINGNRK
jgi:hypothetical protein